MSEITKEQKAAGLYRFVWRWHFFGGMIMGPLLILLAITGAIYLFKPYLEPMMDKPLYYVEQTAKVELSATEQLKAVKDKYPDATISTYTNPKREDFSTQVGITIKDEAYTAFVNPYTAEVLGKLKDSARLQAIILELHGSIMQGANSWGDWAIELAACWAIILLVTGLYLYWPRNKQSFLSVLRIRLNGGSRVFLRDIHSVTAFWMTIMILMLVLTGLPWAGFFGKQLDKVVQWTNTQYYDWAPWDGSVQSDLKMKDVAKTSWAAEKVPVPESVYSIDGMLSVESIIDVAEKQNIHPGYTITFPWDEKGVYVVSTWGWPSDSYKNYATLGIDQYSGKVLTDIRWDDYSPLVKTVEIGIAAHEGRLFGWPNMILNLIACLSLVLIVVTGVLMWWKRRPKGSIGIPAKFEGYKLSIGVIVITILLSILLPIAGLSIAAVFILDLLIKGIRKLIKRNK